jgi:hypothetical protein
VFVRYGNGIPFTLRNSGIAQHTPQGNLQLAHLGLLLVSTVPCRVFSLTPKTDLSYLHLENDQKQKIAPLWKPA